MNEGQKAEKKKQHNTEVFLTQKELAKRWKTSQATIKNIRDNRGISCFCPPSSSRVLYPLDEIHRIEQDPMYLKKSRNFKCSPCSAETDTRNTTPVFQSNQKWEI